MFEKLGKVRGQVRFEGWELARPFKIARGIATHVDLVIVELTAGELKGYGECCPVPRYGESLDSVLVQVRETIALIEAGTSWDELHDTLPAGAARNAVDCAMWDLLAKVTGIPVWSLAEVPPLTPVETVYTISLDTPSLMAAQAAGAGAHKNLKVKLGSAFGDMDRIKAVREVVPNVRLIIDANEGWERDQLIEYLPILAELDIQMVEQPLPSDRNHELAGIERIIPVGADESCHTSADIPGLIGLYDVVNIKFDKTGGLTEALRLFATAKSEGFDVMVGCMLGTSLAMAPAMLIAPRCRFVDLDAPLLIGKDRASGLVYNNGTVTPPQSSLWG
ncbi:N-acetyl-D-Glu racemase DgcA [Kordiimonas pumila]|uniref:Dipeptide epimerase n=1 Tax=Kordiimonas pumila TaxID=2161677 RepID=A0ABV7D0K1_9PROT|nr:N-acetyl-D-Glu racemase DgcA [Kordiimonas pumila]